MYPTSPLVLKVFGMKCQKCAARVRSTLADLPGVASIDVDLEQRQVTVVGQGLDRTGLEQALRSAGFTVPAGVAEQWEITVYGMKCQKCVATLTGALTAIPGVERVDVALEQKRARVVGLVDQVDLPRLQQAVTDAGFSLEPVAEPTGGADEPESLPSEGTASDLLTFAVRGMHCANCVGTVEKVLRALPGVLAARVNLATEQAAVEFDPRLTGPPAIFQQVSQAGYTPQTLDEAAADDRSGREERNGLLLAACLSLPIMPLMWWHPFGNATGWVIFALSTICQWTAGLLYY